MPIKPKPLSTKYSDEREVACSNYGQDTSRKTKPVTFHVKVKLYVPSAGVWGMSNAK